MAYYKSSDNSVYYLDAVDADNWQQWLPGGVVAITNAEAMAITNPPPTLAEAQATRIALLNQAYQGAITAPVGYTTMAGAAASFGQSGKDKANLQNAISGSLAGGVWGLDLWLDVNGSLITPFTYADLQGLAAAMESADIPEFTHLLDKVAAVQAATTVADVEAIAWV